MDGVEERRRRARRRRWEEADLAAVDPAMDRIWRGRGGRGGRRGSNSAHLAWSRPGSAREEGEKGKELPLPPDLDPRTRLAAPAAPRRGLAWPRRLRGLTWPCGLICLRGEGLQFCITSLFECKLPLGYAFAVGVDASREQFSLERQKCISRLCWSRSKYPTIICANIYMHETEKLQCIISNHVPVSSKNQSLAVTSSLLFTARQFFSQQKAEIALCPCEQISSLYVKGSDFLRLLESTAKK